LTDEHLEVLAGDAGLSSDRLDGLSFQAAEQSPDEGRGMTALFLAVEQGEVAMEEPSQVSPAGADVVGGDGGVGQEGDGLGMLQDGHGEIPRQ